MIVMVQTDPDGPPHLRSRRFWFRRTHPVSRSSGPMHVFGKDDAPHGHMHMRFDRIVAFPRRTFFSAKGRGFEISQVRLGPGRIHHCMRSIGAAERAIEMMSSVA